jgi:FAD dependent monooxygenase
VTKINHPFRFPMPQKFQIIVIGSSIAGLTFAHCLDHAGIDYLILEKHKDPEANLGGIIVISTN